METAPVTRRRTESRATQFHSRRKFLGLMSDKFSYPTSGPSSSELLERAWRPRFFPAAGGIPKNFCCLTSYGGRPVVISRRASICFGLDRPTGGAPQTVQVFKAALPGIWGDWLPGGYIIDVEIGKDLA